MREFVDSRTLAAPNINQTKKLCFQGRRAISRVDMNLYIVTQRDPIFIDRFLSRIDYSKFEKIYVFNAPNFGGGKMRGLRKFLHLFGLRATITSAFGAVFASSPLPRDADILNADWHTIEETLTHSQPSESDVLLSVSAPHKISKAVLKKFCKRFNFHSGRLPHYAGMMPLFWQMFAGESHYTITLHELDEDIDKGRIFFEAEIPFEQTLFGTMCASKELSGSLFNLFIAGKLRGSERMQEPSLGFNKYPSNKDIRQLRERFR